MHNLFTIWLEAIGKLIWKEYEFNESSSSYHHTIHLMTYSTIKAKSTINARLTTNWILNHWCTIFWQWLAITVVETWKRKTRTSKSKMPTSILTKGKLKASPVWSHWSINVIGNFNYFLTVLILNSLYICFKVPSFIQKKNVPSH